MPFWSSQTIEAKQRAFSIISPALFNTDNIQHGAYELTLGSEVFTTTVCEKFAINDGSQISIPPGQYALLITNEIVKIPSDTIGFISIKARSKLRGLVNVSGFHVDPGYNGKLKFGVYNAGPTNIVLSQGQRIFLIWFSSLDEPTRDPYPPEKRTEVEKNTITADDVMRLQGEIASPAALDARMKIIEFWFKTAGSIFCAVLLAIIGVYIKNWMDKPCANVPQDPTPQSAQMIIPTETVLEKNKSFPGVSQSSMSRSVAAGSVKIMPENK